MTEKSNTTRVYILDDDRIVSHSLSQILSKSGFHVIILSSVQECLQRMDEMQSGFLLLDQKMPEMTGLEVQQKLVEAGCGVQIIFITATRNEIEAAAMDKGAVKVFEKPFDPNDLIVLLQGFRGQSVAL